MGENIVKRRGGLVHYMAGCNQCHGEGEGHWFSRNAQAVAANHAKHHGHDTWVELGHSYKYSGSGKEP